MKSFWIAPLALGLSSCISVGTYERQMKSCREVLATNKSLTDEVTKLKAQVSQDTASKSNSNLSDIKPIRAQLERGLSNEIAQGLVEIEPIGDNFNIRISEPALFKPNSIALTSEGEGLLLNISRYLVTITDRAFRVESHSDGSPVPSNLKSRFASNWELSSARAASVVHHLEGMYEIDPAWLVAVGCADKKPVSENETPEGRLLNRRIEIVVHPRELTPLERIQNQKPTWEKTSFQEPTP